jgi:hypothetical protein
MQCKKKKIGGQVRKDMLMLSMFYSLYFDFSIHCFCYT